MKTQLTKRFAQNAVLLFLGALLISSCATTSVSKRRYTGGLNLEFSFLQKKKTNSNNSTNLAKANAHDVKSNATKSETTTLESKVARTFSNDVSTIELKKLTFNKTVLSSNSNTLKTATNSTTTIPVVKHNFANKVSFLLSNKAFNKATKRESKSAADKILYLVIAFFIPFLGVLLYEGGVTTHFWISLLLTFLFWLPGFIYAVLVITDSI